jgi:Na+-driven multidrug efflux pump
MYRARFFQIIASLIIVSTVFLNAEAFFKLTKQDEKVSENAIIYIYQFIPSALLITQIDIFRKFILTIGKGYVVFILTLFTLILHIIANFVFVYKWELALKGTAYATLSTNFVMLILMCLYTYNNEEGRKIWFLPDKTTL